MSHKSSCCVAQHILKSWIFTGRYGVLGKSRWMGLVASVSGIWLFFPQLFPQLWADTEYPSTLSDYVSECVLEKQDSSFPEPSLGETREDYMTRVKEFGLEDMLNGSLESACKRELFQEAFEQVYGHPYEEDISDEELKRYLFDDPSSQSSCVGVHCHKPPTYYAGDMIFRWYEGLKDPEEVVPEESYPVVLDQKRKNTLILIHGWQGWDRNASRQPHRHFHNAKEDTISTAALLMKNQGMDLSFSFISGAVDGDDLGMMLQCRPAADSQVSAQEESFLEFLRTYGSEGCRPHAAFNVGYLDWTTLAFNRTIASSEQAIWDPSSKDYIADEDLLSLWNSILADTAKDSTVTIVGHSLGASLAIRLYNVIAKAANAADYSGKLPLSRLILTDPYFTNFGLLPFDVRYWPGKRARKALDEASLALEEIRYKEQSLEIATGTDVPRSFVGVDVYSTTDDATEAFSDANRPLKFHHPETVYVELKVDSIHQEFHFVSSRFPMPLMIGFGLLDSLIKRSVSINKRKHVYPLYWVLETLARSYQPRLYSDALVPLAQRATQRDLGTLSAASSLTNLLRVKRASRGSGWYKQYAGSETLSPRDDVFAYQQYVP